MTVNFSDFAQARGSSRGGVQWQLGLEEMRDIVFNGTAKVTFWGGRVLDYRPASQGTSQKTQTWDLESLASKILSLSLDPANVNKLSAAERAAGIGIAQKLDQLRIETETAIKTANFFTRWLSWVRNAISGILVEGYANFNSKAYENFRSYERNEFLAVFGRNGYQERGTPGGNWWEHPDAEQIPGFRWLDLRRAPLSEFIAKPESLLRVAGA